MKCAVQNEPVATNYPENRCSILMQFIESSQI